VVLPAATGVRFSAVLYSALVPVRENVLAKPNYSFEKRQRDLEKKRKQEEKRLRKLADKKPADGASAEAPADAAGPANGNPPATGN